MSPGGAGPVFSGSRAQHRLSLQRWGKEWFERRDTCVEELPQATLNFSNSLSGWKALGATLSIDYELIPLPVHSRGNIHAWQWLCSGNSQLCLPTSQLESHQATQLPGAVTSPTGQVGLDGNLPSGWDCDSAPCLDVIKLGSKASKTCHLSIQIRQSYTPPVSWSECSPNSVLWLSKIPTWALQG